MTTNEITQLNDELKKTLRDATVMGVPDGENREVDARVFWNFFYSDAPVFQVRLFVASDATIKAHDELLRRAVLMDAERQKQWAAKEAADRIQAMDNHIARNVPSNFQMCTFANFEPHDDRQARVRDTVAAWMGHPPFLVLGGPPATGKTHLAVAAFVTAVRRGGAGGNPMFWGETELITEWRRRHRLRDDDYSPDDLIEGVADHAGLVVIDDIGSVKLTESAWSAIWTIIDARYAHGRPTLFTTNHRLPALVEIVGEKVVSRLASGAKLWIEGPDMRQRRPA
ncbi:MAG TPA: ATP-binding protein [Tepidisphaeraceae bacterium]